MGRTITYTNLLGETVTVLARGKHYIEPRGYFRPPGTGPKDETCGTCEHKTYASGVAGSYIKCNLARHKWTGGRGSDILASAAACEAWALRGD
jgi:hypothetical protein